MYLLRIYILEIYSICWLQCDAGHYSQVVVDYPNAINSMIHMLLHFYTHPIISLNVTSRDSFKLDINMVGRSTIYHRNKLFINQIEASM